MLVTLLNEIALTQEISNSQVTEPKASQDEEVKPLNTITGVFDTIISEGYRPKMGQLQYNFSIINQNGVQNVFANDVEFYKVSTSATLGSADFEYGLSDKYSFGLNYSSYLSYSDETTFSAAAKSLGLKDDSDTTTGMTEPSIDLMGTIVDQSDLRAIATLSFSPKIGDSKPDNRLSGGSSSDIELKIVKRINLVELLLAGSYEIENEQTTKYKSGNKSFNTGGNEFNISIGGNLFFTPSSSLYLNLNTKQTSSINTKYSDSSEKIFQGAYSTNESILGLKVSLDSSLSFFLGYSSTMLSKISGTIGSSKINIPSSTFSGFGFGLFGSF